MIKKNKGFSLVELIIVIAIMAILAGAIGPAIIRYIDKSRRATDVQTGKSSGKSVDLALNTERSHDDFEKPSANPVVVTCNVAGTSETYQAEVVCVVEPGNGYIFDSVEKPIFTEELNLTMDVSRTKPASENRKKMPLKYKKIPDGGTVSPDVWMIIKKVDTGSPEVWIGSGTATSPEPGYRIWPETCDEYDG